MDRIDVVRMYLEHPTVGGPELRLPRSEAPHDDPEAGAADQEGAPLRIVGHLDHAGIDDEDAGGLGAVELSSRLLCVADLDHRPAAPGEQCLQLTTLLPRNARDQHLSGTIYH